MDRVGVQTLCDSLSLSVSVCACMCVREYMYMCICLLQGIGTKGWQVESGAVKHQGRVRLWKEEVIDQLHLGKCHMHGSWTVIGSHSRVEDTLLWSGIYSPD